MAYHFNACNDQNDYEKAGKNNGSIFQSFLFSVTLTFNDIQSNMIMCGNVLPLTTSVANMMTRFVTVSEKYIQVCFNYCL